MRTALIIEVEELLFATLELRSRALHEALLREGVTAPLDVVRRAHAGVPARVALAGIEAYNALDDVGQALVLRRYADAVTESFTRAVPSFDPSVHQTIERLASEFPLGIVTRAERGDAQWLLGQAGLDACFTTIRSLADVHGSAQQQAWSEVFGRLHADRGVAFAPAYVLPGAADAGLQTVAVGPGALIVARGERIPFASVDSVFITSLF